MDFNALPPEPQRGLEATDAPVRASRAPSLIAPHEAVAESRSRFTTVVRDFLEALLLAAVLLVGLQLVVQNTVVKGVSMEPNYVSDQRVIVNKVAYRVGDPRRGDVVVFHAHGLEAEDFIKRIVALPGEEVEIRQGVVVVDGQPISEPYGPITDDASFGPFKVPAGAYFVLGDNRPFSNDSRTWEPLGRAIERNRIVGPVWLSIWPPSAWGVAEANGPGPVRHPATAVAEEVRDG